MATPHEEFRDAVVKLATLYGWECWWVKDSRHSPKGWVDLACVRRGQLLFAELKVGKDKPSTEQKRCIAKLKAVEERAEGILRQDFKAKTAPPLIQVFVWQREVDTLDRLAKILA